MFALEIENLNKLYWKNDVLKSLNLTIDVWDFFWLLWYNWAWKTTLIWILTSIVIKNSWKVKIFWIDIDENFNEAKKKIWIVPQEFNLDIFSKVEDIPVYQWGYYWIDMSTWRKRCLELLKQFNLYEKKDEQVIKLSWWMKRRLMIVRALIHQPQLLILDEPTAWVDVELRKQMWDYLIKLNQNWTTILLTTHYLEEAQTLCNKIAIINKWQIIQNSDKKTLLKLLDKEEFQIEIENKIDSVDFLDKKLEPKIIDDLNIEILVDPKEFSINKIVDEFNKKWIIIKDIHSKWNKLERLFLKLTK